MNEYQYDLSIIVPVYNAAKHVEETFDSILKQKGAMTYEVLMIDDGSTDNSAKICKKYAKAHDHFKYTYQKNSGVSHARNTGLDLAVGKYIMFLDADDLLLKKTLVNIVKFFNKYEDEADILAYPIFIKEFDEIRDHIRSENYEKAGLYDIKKYPHFNQTTINTVIKNLPKDEKIYFDEKLHFAEDAMFNTAMIVRKDKIIVSNKGGYLYRREAITSSHDNANPAHSAWQLLEYSEKMIDMAHSPASKKYIESILFYEYSWRFVARSGLYPLHLNGKEREDWYARFRKVMDFISAKTIATTPYLNRYHVNYFLYEYKRDEIKVTNDENGIYYKVKDKTIYQYDLFKLAFKKIKIIDDILYMEGILQNRGYLFTKGKLKLLVKVNNQTIEVPLEDDVPADYHRTTFKSAVFYRFRLQFKLDRRATYGFWVNYNGFDYPTNHGFSAFVIFKHYIKMTTAISKKHAVAYQRYSLGDTYEMTTSNNAQFFKRYQRELTLKVRRYKGYRRLMAVLKIFDPLYSKRKMWLYNDRMGVFDNGYVQFMNDMNKQDGIERYYIYDKEDINHPKIKAIPKNMLVVRNSNKHRFMFIYSSMILTSYAGLLDYSPLKEETFNFVYDRIKYKLVYLQHGILHAHLPRYYNHDSMQIDYFVVSSDFERDNLLNIYGYQKDQILTTGMPRLQEIDPKKIKKTNKILFAPSWRSSITGGIRADRSWRIDADSFARSDYYRNIKKFLYDKKLQDILKKYDYTLDVKLHPNFTSVRSLFPSKGRVKVIKPNESVNTNEYKLLITDFSSFLFDFARAHTDMMFYYPDYDEFINGNHSYNKLNLDLSKYADTYKDPEELINAIDKGIKKDFKLSKAAITFYDKLIYKADNNAEKIYQTLIKKTGKED